MAHFNKKSVTWGTNVFELKSWAQKLLRRGYPGVHADDEEIINKVVGVRHMKTLLRVFWELYQTSTTSAWKVLKTAIFEDAGIGNPNLAYFISHTYTAWVKDLCARQGVQTAGKVKFGEKVPEDDPLFEHLARALMVASASPKSRLAPNASFVTLTASDGNGSSEADVAESFFTAISASDEEEILRTGEVVWQWYAMHCKTRTFEGRLSKETKAKADATIKSFWGLMKQRELCDILEEERRLTAMAKSHTRENALALLKERKENDLNFPVNAMGRLFYTSIFADQRRLMFYTALLCTARASKLDYSSAEENINSFPVLGDAWSSWIETMQASNRKRIKTPDYALDKHTAEGRKKKRGIDHFYSVGAFLQNPSKVVEDDYEDRAIACYKAGEAISPTAYRTADVSAAKRPLFAASIVAYTYPDKQDAPLVAPPRPKKRKRTEEEIDKELLALTDNIPPSKRRRLDDEETPPAKNVAVLKEDDDDDDDVGIGTTADAKMDVADVSSSEESSTSVQDRSDTSDDDDILMKGNEDEEGVFSDVSEDEAESCAIIRDNDDDDAAISDMFSAPCIGDYGGAMMQVALRSSEGEVEEEMQESSGDEEFSDYDVELARKESKVKSEREVFLNPLRAQLLVAKHNPDSFFATLEDGMKVFVKGPFGPNHVRQAETQRWLMKVRTAISPENRWVWNYTCVRRYLRPSRGFFCGDGVTDESEQRSTYASDTSERRLYLVFTDLFDHDPEHKREYKGQVVHDHERSETAEHLCIGKHFKIENNDERSTKIQTSILATLAWRYALEIKDTVPRNIVINTEHGAACSVDEMSALAGKRDHLFSKKLSADSMSIMVAFFEDADRRAQVIDPVTRQCNYLASRVLARPEVLETLKEREFGWTHVNRIAEHLKELGEPNFWISLF